MYPSTCLVTRWRVSPHSTIVGVHPSLPPTDSHRTDCFSVHWWWELWEASKRERVRVIRREQSGSEVASSRHWLVTALPYAHSTRHCHSFIDSLEWQSVSEPAPQRSTPLSIASLGSIVRVLLSRAESSQDESERVGRDGRAWIRHPSVLRTASVGPNPERQSSVAWNHTIVDGNQGKQLNEAMRQLTRARVPRTWLAQASRAASLSYNYKVLYSYLSEPLNRSKQLKIASSDKWIPASPWLR